MTDAIEPFPGGRVVRRDSGDVEIQISGDVLAAALQSEPVTAIQRRASTPAYRQRGPYILECSLSVTAHIREYEGSFGYMEYEPTGQRSGVFDAEIVDDDGEIDVRALMETPVVFEWPGARMFIAMQVMSAAICERVGQLRTVEVSARVLGVAKYGDTHPARAQAQIAAQRYLPPGT